ncbi:MAG: hypothetical protein RI957_551 [Verrucomicrobiota bacterium]|jgi:hypothetical protein
MSGLFLGMIVTMSRVSVAMPVIAAMGFVEHFHFIKFVTLAGHESQ